MRLRQIEIFYHVYRTGSISGAARALNVSQPSVSKVLRHAEDQLGFDLFLRRKGRLVPTPAADELFIEAEDVYARVRMFNRSLENIRNRKGGHLRLGVLPSLSLSVGPELVARMRSADPLLSFELTTLHTAEILAALHEKRADLCIGFEPVDDPLIANHRVGDGRLVLVSGKSLAEPVDERVLDGADMIGMSESGPLGTIIADLLLENNIAPNEVVTAHTYHVALSLVRKQIGLALTDQFTAYSHLGQGLQRYLLRDLPGYSIFACVPIEHPYPELIETALEQIRLVISELASGIDKLQPPRA
ncbi:LysR family transcriptional regulator [Erythrobacter sp. THAF29]|uniref:LysR family transcriptional regulator n=1 Tax=Erythrobacter sp. THAF29 TaxID=2587851 RepID=UPI001267927A|nr:LysR family transcriptional regulator [Erythrobacter sp. THAF29]QFT76833.1 HTH-type transcriptional regulator CatM [Erythrobacter sp. THAF29]